MGNQAQESPPAAGGDAVEEPGCAPIDAPYCVQGESNLSPEQRAKYDSLLRLFEKQREEWERLSPEEQAEEEAGWRRFRKSMNEDRARIGARLLYLDED